MLLAGHNVYLLIPEKQNEEQRERRKKIYILIFFCFLKTLKKQEEGIVERWKAEGLLFSCFSEKQKSDIQRTTGSAVQEKIINPYLYSQQLQKKRERAGKIIQHSPGKKAENKKMLRAAIAK